MGGTLTLIGLMPIRSELPLVSRMSTTMVGVGLAGWNSSIQVGLSGSSLVGIAPLVGSETKKFGSQLSDGDLPQQYTWRFQA